MPKRAPLPCGQPGCSAYAIPGTGRCEEHPRPQRNQRGYADGKTTERGYGHAWRKLRDRILRRDKGLCQPCQKAGRLTPATEVDHIVEKAHGGTDAMDNLQAICGPCHRAKTARAHTHPSQADAFKG